MGSHIRKKSKKRTKLEEIRYEDVPKYAKRRKREETIKGIGKGLRKFGKKTGKSIRETREKSKPFFKSLGETVKKGIEFEKKAFKFGGEAISKGWEYGFEKPLEMREKSQKEMDKQREELGF